ncbi:MAG: hydroxypyruvate isomerase, partial [Verrucomicrobiota bacterium]
MTKGSLKQSIAYWCFNVGGEQWSLEKICQVAKELHCESVELVDTEEELSVIYEQGLKCALFGMNMHPHPPFTHGYNNPDNWDRLFEQTKKGIDAASRYGCPN